MKNLKQNILKLIETKYFVFEIDVKFVALLLQNYML